MSLPKQLAQFIQTTNENFQLVNERLNRLEAGQSETNQRLDRLETGQSETNQRLDSLEGRFDRLEGRFSNFEGSDYERRVQHRFLSRATLHFNLDTPHIAFSQQGHLPPGMNSIFSRAIKTGLVSPEEFQELHTIDLIIADDNNRYIACEVAMTADSDDITRAKERARILSAATNSAARPAVVTTTLNEPQRLLAVSRDVPVFVIPYP